MNGEQRQPDPRARRPGARKTQRAQAPPPPKNNPLPLILVGVGGGVLLLIILIAILVSGGDDPRRPTVTPEPTTTPEPAKSKVDVSKYEEEGKKKCTLGMKLVRQRVDTKSAVDPEILRFDLEVAYTQLTDGLAAYKTAADMSGNKYDLAEYRRGRDRAITALCDNIEGEARESADKGLQIIRQCESLMTGRALNDVERTKLRKNLKEGKDLIEKGMNLFDRSYSLSGHTFNTTRYGQARKAASMKLAELKE